MVNDQWHEHPSDGGNVQIGVIIHRLSADADVLPPGKRVLVLVVAHSLKIKNTIYHLKGYVMKMEVSQHWSSGFRLNWTIIHTTNMYIIRQ